MSETKGGLWDEFCALCGERDALVAENASLRAAAAQARQALEEIAGKRCDNAPRGCAAYGTAVRCSSCIARAALAEAAGALGEGQGP